MSRSRRKSPFTSWTSAISEKEDKRISNRKFRKKTNQMLIDERYYDRLPLHQKEVTEVYSFAKDGKMYIGKDWDDKYMRK